MDDTPPSIGYIRRNLQRVRKWNPTRMLAGEQEGGVHRMDLNECPFPPSPRVVKAIQDAAIKVNRYPDGVCPEVSERLSAMTGVPADQICWGTGSSELVGNIAMISVSPGDGVVAPGPVWRRFANVFNVVDARVIRVANRADGSVDPYGLVDALDAGTKLLVAVSPNNPSGAMLSAEEITYLAENVPDDVLLYLDEAYFEFARFAGGPDGLKILQEKRRGPWVVTRTFSKAYAMAGMRLGYALTSSDVISNALRAVTSTFNVTALAEAAALAALDDVDYAREIQERTAAERARLVEGLRDLGLEPLPSVTNFVSAALPVPAAPVVEELKTRRIRIGAWGEEGFESFIRISIGLPEDTDAVLAALRDILKK